MRDDAVTAGTRFHKGLRSATAEQADKNHNPCLSKTIKVKLQYGFRTHNKTHEKF